MFSKASFVAIISVAAAQLHKPTTGPEGNPISRPLIEVVPACKPFQITWQPTTAGTVSLLLLRGPSTNVVPLGAPLAEGIANTGSFTWTPASTLEADVSHYGLQIIDDVTGQYQYSTQFGISKDDCSAQTSSAIVSTSSAVASSSAVPTLSSSSLPPYPTTVHTVPSSAAAGTGAPAHNTTIVQPTGAMTVPVTLTPTPTGSESSATSSASEPEFTGAASSIKTGLSLAGAAAFAALML